MYLSLLLCTLTHVTHPDLPVISFYTHLITFTPSHFSTQKYVSRHRLIQSEILFFLDAVAKIAKKRLLASSCLSVLPHVSFLSKICQKIKVSLQSEKNNEYFIRRLMYIFVNMSLNSSYDKMFQVKFVVKIKTCSLC